MRKSSWAEETSRGDMLNAINRALCSKFPIGDKLNSIVIKDTYSESNSFCIAGDF